MALASRFSGVYNFVYKTPFLRQIANRLTGFHPKRTMPLLHRTTLREWFDRTWREVSVSPPKKGKVFFFCDEFTNYNDVDTGQKAIELLRKLGYEVAMPDHAESGRTWLSKGMVRRAQRVAVQNVQALKDCITATTPLIGLEPSAILTFRDEYPDLVPPEIRETARQLGANALLFEEWLAKEIEKGAITARQFTKEQRHIKLHGHCHQKALTSVEITQKVLSLPENYTVEVIPSGCCGMAGSFGYETEHYDISMQIGELVLFPAVRAAKDREIIAAPGTSCRHQIKDGTGRQALHPVEVLWEAVMS
jgi:Fe-S oxidoreductase